MAGAVDIAYFPEASRTCAKGPYDIGLVEGSITTHHDAERIQQVRRQCRTLVTIGACATAGGIQALRNWKDVNEFIRVVYASPQFISTLKLSTPIAEHVPVDFELRGCPINKYQLIELITRHAGRAQAEHPHLQRLHGMQAQGQRLRHGGARNCLPGTGDAGRLRRIVSQLMTAAAMAATGPWKAPTRHRSPTSFASWARAIQQISRAFRGFNAWAWQFRKASEECERT